MEEEEAKESFRDDFQRAIDSTFAGDMLIVAENYNSKPGSADMATRHILVKLALGSRRGNGDRLVNLANRIVVISNHIQHP